MFLDLTDEQKALEKQVRAYMDDLLDPETRAELAVREAGGPLYHRAMQRMGADGWLGLGWPVEHGGQGRGAVEQFIFFDEVQRAGFPIPFLTINTVGPTLAKFGTDAQKAEFLPRILAGTCHFSIGYTEPSAGTDLASLVTRADRDGDDYVINGQKIFTSLADHADYLWLAVRTDPDVKKHKGISIIIVPTANEGVSLTPLETLGDNLTSAVYLEDVRVPVTNLVGEENGGWRLITNQLNHERVALNAVGPIARLAEETRHWAADAEVGDGRRVLDLPWVRANLARVDAKIEVLKLLNWQQAWKIDQDQLRMEEASAIKVYGSEFYVEGFRALMEIFGGAALLQAGSPGAVLRGQLERYHRAMLVLTFGGGTNEVQRDIISAAGLRIPRAPR
jgi:alkylation response protein AidB-like acyl-CoA dehydrogenase